MKLIECPPAARFTALLEGKLPPEAAESLAEHVETCARCARTVASLEPDALTAALRRGDVATPSEPALQRLLEQARTSFGANGAEVTVDAGLAESAVTPNFVGSLVANRNETLALLRKPEAPGELGRLGEYRVLQQLGQGGMGIVFEAEDIRLHRRVALKVMKPEIARNEHHRERFLREARTAAKVESDHICPIYQVGEENGMPFIAMPFLKGESLDARLQSGTPLTLAEIVRIGREVAEGLAAAHEAGLIHRDIKPANIWLEMLRQGTPRARILDFGLARYQEDNTKITQSGAILGTPAFMAPEQARGDKNVDARADLFSLGCVLYALCTGDVPFKAETTMGVLMALAVEEPTPPHEVFSAVPRALSDLIMQLLQKDAARRPASAKEVIAALRSIEQTPGGLTEVALPMALFVSDTQSPVRPPARSKARWWMAACLCLLVLGGGAFSVYQLFLNTPNGRLIVEIEGDDFEARFKNGKILLHDKDGKELYTLSPSVPKDLPAGQYRLDVLGAGAPRLKVVGADGLEVETDKFELRRGGQVRVRIVLEPIVLAKKDAPPIAEELRSAAADLSQVKPFYEARLQRAVDGWLIEKKGFYDQGFRKGVYAIDLDAGTSRSCFCPAEPVGDFVCEVVGRAIGAPHASWGVEIQNVARGRYLYFLLNAQQELEIRAVGKEAETFEKIGPLKYPAIKAGEAFNTLRIARRGSTIEVLVNGVAVGPPVKTEYVTTPATFGVLAFADPNQASRAEFQRLTIWKNAQSATGMAETGVLDFAEIHDADEKRFDAWIAQMKKEGLRPVSLSIQSVKDQPRYTAIAIKEDKKTVWEFTRDTPESADLVEAMLDKNYAVYVDTLYRDQGKTKEAQFWLWNAPFEQAGIWVGEITFIQKKIGKKQSRRLVHRSAVLENGVPLWSIVQHEGDQPPWVERYNQSLEDCKAWIEKQKALGWRPTHLYAYGSGLKTLFGNILVQEPKGPDWDISWTLTTTQYEAELTARRKHGFRPQCAVAHDAEEGSPRFSVIWVRYRAEAN